MGKYEEGVRLQKAIAMGDVPAQSTPSLASVTQMGQKMDAGATLDDKNRAASSPLKMGKNRLSAQANPDHGDAY